MHQEVLFPCACLTAVVAAMRSTWSPCGISMLSTLTPYSERARGNRYAATVSWFVAGAALGGAALGALISGLAALVALTSLSTGSVAAIAAVAAVVCIASDYRVCGLHLPLVPRQVNEQWVSRYRRWVYALSFGAQIGVGISTYVMTAAVYLMVVLGALTGSPLLSWLIGVGFGVTRGLAILLGAGLSTPAAIRSFHRRFEGLAPLSRNAAVVAQVGVLAVVAAAIGRPELIALVGAAAGLCVLESCRRSGLRSGYAGGSRA
jgi:MFS family permease